MKQNRTRLIALLLALCLLMGALPTLAFAENSIQTMDDYQNARARVEEALTAPDVPIEQTNQYLVTRTSEASSIVTDPIEGEIVAGAANEFTLPVARKLILTTAEAAEAYRWQIRIGDEWANIVGDTENKITLTYAKLQNALSGDAAYVRCALTRAGETVYTDEALVRVSTEVETESAPVTEQIPVTSYYQPSPVSRAKQLNANVLANEEKDTFSIIINYNFENGTQAANPWTATIGKGSKYATTVTSPTVVGYKPDKDIVEIAVDNIQKDETYTVTYFPAEVKFTVKHYQQNVDNDNYTLVDTDTETKTGFTEKAVGEGLAKKYEGFYSLLYDTTTKIAADGSTVVEIYYDRYYYLMNFDLDGGYGVEPIYARYGAPISIGTPTKAGYTFTGWQDEEEKAVEKLPTTMPAKNSSYTAQWQVGDSAKVTIVVWGENADDEKYSFYHNTEIMAKPGEKLTLDSLQGKTVCGKEEHTHTDSCISCSHVHDAACYGATKQENPVDGKTNSANENIAQFKALTGGVLENGKVYRVKCEGAATTSSYDKYYLYFNNTWYLVSSSDISGRAIATSTKMNAHSHWGNRDNKKDQFWVYNSKLTCTHTHVDSCYTCGKEEHTHTSACYYNTSFMENPNLWTLVRSDEVTVAADGTTILNVYYDRVEFTLTFRENYETVATIKEKWGAAISEEFEKAPFSTTYNGRAWKCTETSKYDYALQTLDRMPAFDATFKLYDKNSDTKKTIYYYVQKVGTTVNANQWPSNANNFDLLKQVDTYFNYATYDEEYHEIQGFTRYRKEISFNESYGSGSNRVTEVKNFKNNALNLYYMRNSYTLKFFNRTAELTDKETTVQYEASLKDCYFEPAYPSDLEPNAYVFAGWYTTAGCYDGSEADLDTMTMPASGVILYAKWAPKTHTVKTYLTKDAMDNGEAALKTWDAVPHGTSVTNPPEKPENGEYEFVGWFYMDDVVEKAFDFSMPVNRDLNLYAKWSSNSLVKYTIHYQLEDGKEIAPSTEGSALAGATKTFDAKAGTQLNEGYRTGYFPKTGSHSLTMNIEGGNEFIFVYVKKPEVNYTVRYLEKDTEKVLHEEKNDATRDAVITEKFEQITGYAPDAYQKRLVLSAEGENVITFWYVKDNEHAPVQIIHLTQNIEGDNYTEYQSSTNLNGVIGQTYTEKELTIGGFTYNAEKSNASGKLEAEGLVLNLYYDRIEYPYEFKFLEQGTDTVLAAPVTGNARYQAQVTETAKTIPGYTLVKGTSESQKITIAIEDPADTASKNVKTFYYVEDTVDIKYQVVGPDGSGTLGNYQDNGIGVVNGTVKGSTPTAASGFKFVGWFKDAACTQSVNDADWVDANNKLTPQKTKSYGTGTEEVMGYEAATYYAKFEYDVADLTITKVGCQDIDENQSFLFDVTGPDGFSKRVVIKGNDSVTIKGLKIGTYTVKEVTDWSWRYTLESATQTIKLEPTGENKVEFVNSRAKDKWLGGDAYSKNVFGNTPN